MDCFTLFIVLYIVFISTCIAIIVLYDSDILTFLAVQWGKSPAEEFRGKVIWITGASSGIGEALVKEIVSQISDVKIVISARRSDELNRVCNECLDSNREFKKSNILALPFDMTDTNTHQIVFNKVIETFGKLDILVSNAGRSQRAAWHEISLDVDKQVFDLNVFSLIHLNRIAVKYFLEHGNGGQLAVTSSIAGFIGAPYSGSYTASKHALHGYFECLRREISDEKIHITLLCPGPTFSPFLKVAFTGKSGENLNSSVNPTDRRMTAERCALLCVVAIANKLDVCWMGVFPVMIVVYINTYMPYFAAKILRFMINSNLLMKLRDGGSQLPKND